MTEYLDIVNERDEVIGRDTRANVHAKHEIHRGVHVLVFRSDASLLLQRRSRRLSYYPGSWDASAGGQVAAGETYEAAAVRELEEELACPPGPLELLGVYDAFSSRQREKRAVFVHTCDGPFHPYADEIDEIAFASSTELERMLRDEDFTEGFRRTLEVWRSATQ